MKESLSVKHIVRLMRSELSAVTSPEEAYQMTWLLMEHLRGYSKTDLVLQGSAKITHSEHLFVQKALERLKNHEPIQYVLGKTEFFGLPFKVNPSVLIPRPETEELVQWLLGEPFHPGMSLLDVGTGSGCMAISIKKERPLTHVCGWDISPDALATAADNALLNGVEISFEQHDILLWNQISPRSFDIIVSNPPYVCDSEKTLMDRNVLDYEPYTALFVPDEDALLFYRAIARYARHALSPNGCLFFEINQAFGPQVVALLKQEGFNEVTLKRDLSGRDRMVRAR